MNTYDEVLKDLEDSFNKGEINESTYQELKNRYTKLKNDYPEQKIMYAPLNLRVYGSQEINSEQISIAGMGRIPGGVMLKKISASGMVKILDDVEINGLECAGYMRSKGSMKSHDDVEISGAARVKGNITVNGKVEIAGSLKVFGSLAANEVNIEGYTKIEKNITAENVIIKRGEENVRLPKLSRSKIFGDITGHEIVDLKDVRVKGDVRGKIVKIAQNCKVDGTVYYVDDLLVTGSKIENPVKISIDELEN
jgi:predicted acyltransferase (DUF342 family)